MNRSGMASPGSATVALARSGRRNSPARRRRYQENRLKARPRT